MEEILVTYILGVTGGIGSGKSTVSNIFKSLNFPVVDADEIARKVVAKGSSGLQKVVSVFGKSVLLDSGELNLQKLGAIIFNNSAQRQLLDDVLNSEIKQEIQAETDYWKAQNSPLIIWDIPLLYEQEYDKFVDSVMVVYVPSEIQLERLQDRDGIDKKAALAKINSQLSMENKKKQADVVIYNHQTIEHTRKQVEKWLLEHRFINN